MILWAGCAGGLCHDRDDPKAGIYTSGFIACKLGWWLGIYPTVSESVVNEDGSRSYDITVTVENTLTWDEYNHASVDFITAGSGSYGLYTHFFAPEGGSISNFTANKEHWRDRFEYEGLQNIRAAYYLDPGRSIVFSYTVTTAPGVDAPLGLSMTPTLQNYWT